jgi:hypothetical protein
MHEPEPLAAPLQQAMDSALRPMFGERLPDYYAATEAHQAEARELIERARSVERELIDAALDRLTFFGGERRAFLGAALEHTQAQRNSLDQELHAALVEARERYQRRVNALMEDAKGED